MFVAIYCKKNARCILSRETQALQHGEKREFLICFWFLKRVLWIHKVEASRVP